MGKLSFLSASALSTEEEDRDVLEDIEAILAEGSPNPLPPTTSQPTGDLNLDLIMCTSNADWFEEDMETTSNLQSTTKGKSTLATAVTDPQQSTSTPQVFSMPAMDIHTMTAEQ